MGKGAYRKLAEFSPSLPSIWPINMLLYLSYTFCTNVHIILNGGCISPER